jgi:glutamate 5-kinase
MPGVPSSLRLQRIVIKIGTGTLTDGPGSLHLPTLRSLALQIRNLKAAGCRVAVVSSGAVGMGMGRLGLAKRPTSLRHLQACAAVGQSLLTETWQKHLARHGINAAQLLFTRDDLESRKRHLAARATLETLWDEGIVPVINENDSISAAEIKFGDNDVLSALVASLLQADLLCLLTSVDGLMNFETGELISFVEEITPAVRELATGTSSPTAVGGMVTKLEAARIATRSGCGVLIGHGRRRGLLDQVLAGEMPGTFFPPAAAGLKARSRWLAFFSKPQGRLLVDAGAEVALRSKPCSLLAKGLTGTTGKFAAGSLVDIAGPDGQAFARGIVRLGVDEIAAVTGKSSREIAEAAQGARNGVVVHRDSLVLV